MTEVTKGDKSCFIDSNIWLYAFIETPHKSLIAKSLVKGVDITLSTQVINEVCVNLIKKALYPEKKIRNLIESFYNKYNVLEINRYYSGILFPNFVWEHNYTQSFALLSKWINSVTYPIVVEKQSFSSKCVPKQSLGTK